jgi:hypothetical protein
MNKNELKSNYYIFGNKGSVWSNACHISKSQSNATLCGSPMLSNNWAIIEKIEHIGCPKCLKMYELENEPVIN